MERLNLTVEEIEIISSSCEYLSMNSKSFSRVFFFCINELSIFFEPTIYKNSGSSQRYCYFMCDKTFRYYTDFEFLIRLLKKLIVIHGLENSLSREFTPIRASFKLALQSTLREKYTNNIEFVWDKYLSNIQAAILK
jgi:hypothetical protein